MAGPPGQARVRQNPFAIFGPAGPPVPHGPFSLFGPDGPPPPPPSAPVPTCPVLPERRSLVRPTLPPQRGSPVHPSLRPDHRGGPVHPSLLPEASHHINRSLIPGRGSPVHPSLLPDCSRPVNPSLLPMRASPVHPSLLPKAQEPRPALQPVRVNPVTPEQAKIKGKPKHATLGPAKRPRGYEPPTAGKAQKLEQALLPAGFGTRPRPFPADLEARMGYKMELPAGRLRNRLVAAFLIREAEAAQLNLQLQK
jgi:hypothetical protein